MGLRWKSLREKEKTFSKVETKQQKELKELRRKNTELSIKNNYLSKRSFELGKIKLKEHLSQRTIRLCDSALFSDYIGYIDEAVLEADIEFVDISDAVDFTLLRSDCGYKYFRLLLENGELAIFKALKNSSDQFHDKSIILLSHELKILNLVGSHQNIIQPIGLSCPGNQIFGSLFRYHSAIPLNCYLREVRTLHSSFVKNFINGFCEGLCHLHSKDILHNLLTGETLFVDGNDSVIITNFSWACRVSSVTELTEKQKKIFKNSRHLPPKVKNGDEPPSRASDKFSFGFVLRILLPHLETKCSLNESICLIVNGCFRMEQYMNLWGIVNRYLH